MSKDIGKTERAWREAGQQEHRERGEKARRGLKWHSLSVDPRQLSCGLSHDIIMCTCPCITDYLTDRTRIYTRRLCSARCGYSVLAAARLRLPAAYDKISELVPSRCIAFLLLTWPIRPLLQVQGVIKEGLLLSFLNNLKKKIEKPNYSTELLYKKYFVVTVRNNSLLKSRKKKRTLIYFY